MRRFFLITGLALIVSGCQLRDVFSARADVAAEAGTAELESERLGTILATPKQMQPNREAAEFLANLWVDYALLAQAVARGEDLSDSATAAQAMWPELAELKGIHWHDTLVARRGVLPANAVDTTYQGEGLRVLQHILFRVPETATPEERQVARQRANTVLGQLRGGADFGPLAREHSGDGSAADDGFLPPSPRGAFVPAFDSAAWALAPGATSGIVETPFGYHIIRRPGLEAVRERLHEHLLRVAGGQLDSVYMDSLATANNLEIAENAPTLVREAVTDPAAHASSTARISTFDGGGLTVGEAIRWVRALPAQFQQQIGDASDEDLRGFARVLSQNLLLLREADRNNIRITPDEWNVIHERYTMMLDTLRAELRLGADVADSTVSEEQRVATALLKVDQYLDRLVAGQGRMIPLPAALGSVLRSRADVELNDAGIARAVQYAVRERGDSGAAVSPGGFAPAPGGAPIPGGIANEAAGAPPAPAGEAAPSAP